MKQVKRNKQRVWRKTYGKPFIRRRAFVIAQMAVASAQAIASINIVGCAFGSLAGKAIATATAVVNFSKAMTDQSSKMNEGFINK